MNSVLNKNPTSFIQPSVTCSQAMSCLKEEHPWELRILHHCNYYNLFIYLFGKIKIRVLDVKVIIRKQINLYWSRVSEDKWLNCYLCLIENSYEEKIK